jgi:sarcosine oxidase
VIVIGLGAMGSAAVYHLAKRGVRVLGLEQYQVAHDRGSSHGVNRIFRLAYYEHPGYVPLMRRSIELWNDLERIAGEQLVHVIGSIDAGPEDSQVFQGSLESCLIHGLTHEVLDSTQLSDRYPGYRLPQGTMSVYQPDGGFVLSERCIAAHVDAATTLGAEIHAEEEVTGWEVTLDDGVLVETGRGSYRANSLVISTGAWAGGLIPALADSLVPERQVVGWFEPKAPELFAPARFPVFNLSAEEGRYYGFPIYEIPGFKIGRYHHLDQTATPGSDHGPITPEDEAVLRMALSRYFPEADGPAVALKTCMFTNSPDEHFVIGPLPGVPQVQVAAGFSGHGFKFAAVVGEILSDLAMTGTTRHDITMFSPDRFG